MGDCLLGAICAIFQSGDIVPAVVPPESVSFLPFYVAPETEILEIHFRDPLESRSLA